MNIKELDERIKQLKDLVASANDTIKLAEEMVGLAEKEMDKLADRRRESGPKFERVKKGKKYYIIKFERYEGSVVVSDTEDDYPADKGAYDNNNYFHTEKRAQEVADKINLLLKLERLHDTFCPEYVPNWNDSWSDKWLVYYKYEEAPFGNRYKPARTFSARDCCEVYFPTEEIAQKVCDILNAEERMY